MATHGLTQDEQKSVEAFRAQVVDPSMTKLVVLDFWAEWCGPCKQLTPVLEKVAADYAEKGVVLAKINVDENGFIASQFQVRSIPTVYAMFQGQPVADLTQARTESALKAMLDQLLAKLPVEPGVWGEAAAPDITPMLAEGETALSSGDAEAAYMAFGGALQLAPDSADAVGGLIRAMVAMDRLEEAGGMLSNLPDGMDGTPAIERARAALTLALGRADPAELLALRDAAAAAPDDFQARFDLAVAEMAEGNRDAAADALLTIIAADKDWNEGAARAKLLSIFDTIGITDPWVAATRRRLSAALFG